LEESGSELNIRSNSSTENLTYDADGNVLTRQTRAGATIMLTHDTLNRLSTKWRPAGRR
jgi:YD repeat-containing protein